MDEDESRALLAAYLPADEPAVTPLADLVGKASAVRRRRRAVLATVASVVVVLAGSAVAVALTGDRGAPASVPAPVSAAARPTPSSAPATTSAPAGPPCDEASRSNDPGAKAWATWVRTKLGPAVRPAAGPVQWVRMCELDLGYAVFPPHVQNHAEFALPVRSKPGAAPTGTDNLTAATDKFDRLPDLYRAPCKDNVITENVVCRQTRLPDGSLLVRRDFYDILIYGDPKDPSAKRDKQAVRDATRIFADGRTVTAGLVYNGQPQWKTSFDRHVLTLDQLAAIVTDPAALTLFPHS